MRIEHSPLLNDFVTFYIQTRVDGELRYETWIYLYPEQYYVVEDTRSGNKSAKFSYDDESALEAEIKSRVERMIYGT